MLERKSGEDVGVEDMCERLRYASLLCADFRKLLKRNDNLPSGRGKERKSKANELSSEEKEKKKKGRRGAGSREAKERDLLRKGDRGIHSGK